MKILLLILVSLCQVAIAEPAVLEGSARNYPFTPANSKIASCERAGFTGPFVFLKTDTHMFKVKFVTTGKWFGVYHDYGRHYSDSATGDISLSAEVDFDKGRLSYDIYLPGRHSSCAGTFNPN